MRERVVMVYVIGRGTWCTLLLIFCFLARLDGGNSTANAVALDQQGNIVLAGFANIQLPVAGTGTTNNGTNTVTNGALARLLPDGTPDTSFNPDGSQPGLLTIDLLAVNGPQPTLVANNTQNSDSAFTAVAIDKNNKIVLAGFVNIGFNASFVVARLNTDGSLDQTFNPNSSFFPGGPGVAIIQVGSFVNTAQGVAIDSLGRIVVVGTTDNGFNTDVAVLRLTTAGSYDLTFNAQGPTPGLAIIDVMGTNEVGAAVDIDAANNIYVGGSIGNGQTTDFLVMKLLPTGVLDTTFNQFGMFPGVILENLQNDVDNGYALKLDANNNVVIAGSSSNGLQTDFAILRFLPNGTLDQSFNPAPSANLASGSVRTSISGREDVVFGLALDSNQRIVVTGYSNVGINQSFVTARYTPQGALDSTFGPTQPLPGVIITDLVPVTEKGITNDNAGRGVVVQATTNTIIATGFSSFNLTRSFTTINYLANGSLNALGFAAQSLFPGIAFTVFQPVQNNRGNGVPTFLGGGTAIVDPEILDALRTPLLPTIPQIAHEGPIVSNQFQPQLNGIASPNALITVFVQDVPFASTTATIDGAWSLFLPPLLEGNYTLTVLATDPISGLSLASMPVPLVISTQAPQPPRIESPFDADTVTTARIVVEGRAEPDTMVTLFSQEKVLGKVRVAPTGLWAMQTERLADGVHNVVAVATNTAGTSSIPSEVVSFIVDTGAQRAPRILSPKTKFISNNKTMLVRGDAKPNSTIALELSGKGSASVILKVNNKGAWSYTFTALKNGAYRLMATTVDKLFASEPVLFTIDTNRPKPAMIQGVQSSKGFINGLAEPLSTITFYMDGKREPLGKTLADAQGAWSFTPTRQHQIPPGTHTITVSVADKAGNVSSLVKRELEMPF